MLLGFDPGKDKCGVAIMTIERKIETHQVITSDEVIKELQSLIIKYPVDLLIMGNQTTSKIWQRKLQKQLPSTIPITLVDEYRSSLEARDRYWDIYPPKGIMRFIPLGMRLPPRPVDDIVAIILIERYLDNLKK